MSFGKINKIIKFIDKFVVNNNLEKVTQDNYNASVQKILKEGKEYFPEITFDLVNDILGKKYKLKYSYEKEIEFDNGKNCFPEFLPLYPDVEIPEKYQKLEDHFQKLKALPQPEQRTKEWYEYRHNRITASDTAAAIDENPYEPVESFILKKCDPDHPFYDNHNVYHGKKYELIATKIYEHIFNTQVFEFGALPSERHEFLGASPDGICSAKTLDNKFSEKLGTMLEIKCVAPNGRTIETSGAIPGHICPYYYYLQVQQQLECCDLEVCDFWQCKLIEYKSREEYLFDKCLNTVHTEGVNGKKVQIDSKIKKGMLLQFYPFTWEAQFDGDEKVWKSKFIYPPRLDMTEKQYDEWFIKTMNNLHIENPELVKTHYFHKIIYWKLEQSHNQPIQRDRKLFDRILPILKQTWERVNYYRNNLYKLDELKEIVERRKKYIKIDTNFNINHDVIKNNVLFLENQNTLPPKEKKKTIPKNIKQNVECDFVDDDNEIVNCDFIDNEPTKEVIKNKKENKTVKKIETVKKEENTNNKKIEKTDNKKTEKVTENKKKVNKKKKEESDIEDDKKYTYNKKSKFKDEDCEFID